MKAVVDSCVRSSVPGIKADSRCMVGKMSPTKPDQIDTTEMKAYFNKLQSLVPSMNKRDGKIDKTELLQHVIDYILDLEEYLAKITDNGISREPLAEKSDINIMNGGDFVGMTIADFDYRPPSK